MNRMTEAETYFTLKTCLEHPNIEIIQLVDIPTKEVVMKGVEEVEHNGKKVKKVK